MKFSICIPNYNYGGYIGRTIQSVLDQDFGDFEILISDNCSTDESLEIVRTFKDCRIHLSINSCNVGFAGNLDRAARRATGDFLIMLSSDDLMRPKALATYHKFIQSLGPKAYRAIFSSSEDLIDSDDRVSRVLGPSKHIWTLADRFSALDHLANAPVYCVEGVEQLRRSMKIMKNPFHFVTTCYSRQLYEAVEGYGGGRVFAPDKWFHWKLLSEAEYSYYIDIPLFAYRWHSSNQVSQEAATGALKSLIDEYLNTLEVDASWLLRTGMSRDDLIASFVEHDIARHGLATLARKQRMRAQRILDFGRGVYPLTVRKNYKCFALWLLLKMGLIGQLIASWLYKQHLASVGIV